MERRIYLQLINALILLGFIALAGFPAAWAQDDATPAQTTSPPDMYDGIPDEYLEAADEFYGQCASDEKYYYYYDCACLTVRYLDKKIEMGPAATDDYIMLQIQNECADSTYTTGVAYSKCLGNAALLPRDVFPPDYCECYANTYGKLFEQYNLAVTPRNLLALRSRAHSLCYDPVRGEIRKQGGL